MSPINRHRMAGRLAMLVSLAACGSSPQPPQAAPVTSPPAISPDGFRSRLSIFASDSMMGRQAGTAGNVKATEWLAAEAERLGLEPAGENGSYFQTIPLVSRVLAGEGSVSIGARQFAVGTDFIPRDQGPATRAIDGTKAVYGGVWGDSARMIAPDAAAGKLVVLTLVPGPGLMMGGIVNRLEVTQRFRTATGIAIASLDSLAPAARELLRQAPAQLVASDAPELPAYLYVTTAMAEAMLGQAPGKAQPGDRGVTVHGSIGFRDVPLPSPARNVVALLPGTDPKLRGELVALGAHSDHLGVAANAEDHDSLHAWNLVMRPRGVEDAAAAPDSSQAARIRQALDSVRRLRPGRRDSIYNGADDDGSGSVSLLEIAQALRASPPRRSVLFVWHTGEELGLLGSDWFTRHPTVARDSIVTQLNMDMIGRGPPSYLILLGSRRLSTELGDLVERVNTDGRHGFAFDYSYDAPGHPEQGYCRSDHYMYARFGIPVTFFTTGPHSDYHEITDEVQYIDFGKAARVSGLVADIARTVGNLDHAPAVDKPKPDLEAPCKQ